MKDRCESARRASLRRTGWGRGKDIRPSERKRWEWGRRVFVKYGLTAEDVARMWDKQRGRCPLCDADLRTKVWVIDHDHKTGRFRGLLDAWCNHRVLSIIERAGPKRVRNALIYLGR